jgi:hypothetical protein
MTYDEFQAEVERQTVAGKRIIIVYGEVESPKQEDNTALYQRVAAIKRIRELEKMATSKESLAAKTRQDGSRLPKVRKARYEERADNYDAEALQYAVEAHDLRKKFNILKDF